MSRSLSLTEETHENTIHVEVRIRDLSNRKESVTAFGSLHLDDQEACSLLPNIIVVSSVLLILRYKCGEKSFGKISSFHGDECLLGLCAP
jgi:hypothetical protein